MEALIAQSIQSQVTNAFRSLRTHLSEVPDESPVGSPTLAPDHSAANADVDPLSVDDLTPPTPRGTMSRLKRRRMTKLFPEDLTIAQSPSVFLPILTLIFRVNLIYGIWFLLIWLLLYIVTAMLSSVFWIMTVFIAIYAFKSGTIDARSIIRKFYEMTGARFDGRNAVRTGRSSAPVVSNGGADFVPTSEVSSSARKRVMEE